MEWWLLSDEFGEALRQARAVTIASSAIISKALCSLVVIPSIQYGVSM